MSSSRRMVLVCLAAVALCRGDGKAAGVLVPRGGQGAIAIQSQRVRAVVEDALARTTVRQTFVSRHAGALEAIYEFPVPEGAALVDVALELGGQRLEGLLVERGAARRAYDALAGRKRDPALLEQTGRSSFRLSVYPVLPEQPTVVEIAWIETLPLVGGERHYVYPLAMEGAAAVTEHDLTISVELRSSAPLRDVACSERDVHVALLSPHEARASLERCQASLSRDFTIVARTAAEAPALAAHVFRAPGHDAEFAFVVTPPVAGGAGVLARDVTLALDVSGSMKGGKIEQAKAAALYLLEHLRERDRIALLLFNDSVRRYAPEPVPATPENLASLREFVAAVEASGGTALGDAVAAACAGRAEAGRVGLVAILTDGRPTVGVTEPAAIVVGARGGGERGLKTFAFGVGADLDSALLEGIAAAGGGAAEVFRPEGEIESRLRRFVTRTESPVFAGLALEIGGQRVDDLLPRPLPDVYLGEQVVLTGTFAGEGVQRVVLRAAAEGEPLVLETAVDFGTRAAAAAYGAPVARDLYARARLEYLERALRLRAGLPDAAYFAALARGAPATGDELVEAQVELSLATGVQCPRTSFLALLPEDRARLDPRDRALLEEAAGRATARRRELAGASGEVVGGDDGAAERSASIVLDDEVTVGGGAGGRFGGKYGGRAAGKGGGKASQQELALGLDWLARQQRVDGDMRAAPSRSAAGATGLALLAFLGAGNTVAVGQHRETVRAATKFLMAYQDPGSGAFVPDLSAPGALQDHVLATLAMTETYGLSKWPVLRESAQRGVGALVAAQREDGSFGALETTGFAALALMSADDFGLAVPAAARDGVLRALCAALPGALAARDARAAAIVLLGTILLDAPLAPADAAAATGLLESGFAAFAIGASDPEQAGVRFFAAHAAVQLGGETLALAEREFFMAAAGSAADSVETAALRCLVLEAHYRYDRVAAARKRP